MSSIIGEFYFCVVTLSWILQFLDWTYRISLTKRNVIYKSNIGWKLKPHWKHLESLKIVMIHKRFIWTYIKKREHFCGIISAPLHSPPVKNASLLVFFFLGVVFAARARETLRSCTNMMTLEPNQKTELFFAPTQVWHKKVTYTKIIGLDYLKLLSVWSQTTSWSFPSNPASGKAVWWCHGTHFIGIESTSF